jgi:signal transduction histidine kinase/phage shock protein PspC (stress-responsive transcriptional regulator)
MSSPVRSDAPLPAPGRPVPKLLRRTDGKLVAGVAGGLADHLGVSVAAVRVTFALLTGISGVGLLLYAAFWAVVPQAPSQRLGPPRADRTQLLLYAAFSLGLLLALRQVGVVGSNAAVLPLVVVAAGAALIWRQADESQRRSWSRLAGRLPWRGLLAEERHARVVGAVRLVAGALLVVAGLIGFLAFNHELAATRDGLIATGVILGGVAVVTGPWWWRTWTELADERRERIRSQERADLAAHVHDSVLHTLALIQRQADDPREVARLARGQERELRSWLYRPTGSPDERLAAALEQAAAEVEDSYAIQVEVVVVGDCAVDDRLRGLVQAAREAMVNAGRHAKVDSISLYAEVEDDEVSVFVRDRGRGFDPEEVPADRHGIAGSIVARMERHGGRSSLRSAVGEGTEVRLHMTRSAT